MLAAALAGCGGTGDGPTGRELTLVLDGAWSAEHAGIALADERAYAAGEGIGLAVRPPARGEDPARLVDSEQADAAVMSIHALGLARRRGRDLVGVAAITQRPLTGLLAGPGVRPGELTGRVALTGRPGDAAVARSIVEREGGDPEQLDFRRGGGDALALLADGDAEAVAGALPLLAPAARAAELRARPLTLPGAGGPVFPELLIVVKRYTLEDFSGAVRGLAATLGRGYREAQVDPESAASALTARRSGLDRSLLLAQIDAVAPSWTAGADYFGQLREPRLRAWADWSTESGLLRQRPDVGRAFAPGLLDG